MERTVRTSDGRVLAVQEGGDPTGMPVLVHNGTPMSRHLYGPNAADAAEQGLRLISYDRPGTAARHSTRGGALPMPQPTSGPSAPRLRSAGWRCGAFPAADRAYWRARPCCPIWSPLPLPSRHLRLTMPKGLTGLMAFRPPMPTGGRSPTLTRYGPVLTKPGRTNWPPRPAAWFRIGPLSLSAPDAAVLTGELAEFTVRTNHEALAPGSQGWWDDSYGLIRPWGCDLADISIPVLLLHGRQDKFIPIAHAQWLAAHIPGVEARLLEDDGHLTLQAHRVSGVHSWLKQRL